MAKTQPKGTADTSALNAPAVWMSVSDLRPNPRNPRRHGEETPRLARTILRTAWGAPIVAQSRSRRIIGGHGRLEAALLIMRGVEVDGEMRGGAEHSFGGPPGCVPVRLVDVSDAEAEAMTLADNASALQGRDDASLAVEMATRSFERGAPLMADMGYGADDLDRMVRAAGDAVIAATQGDPAAAFGALPDGDKPPGQHMAFQFTDEQAAAVLAAIDRAPSFDGSPSERKASALAVVCEAYVG
jgi:hypothetical protein